MSPTSIDQNKQVLNGFRTAMYDGDKSAAWSELEAASNPEAQFHLSHPFESLEGPKTFFDQAITPLFAAMPDVERRDHILIGGEDEHSHQWVGCGGFFCGTFTKPFLDIPATGHIAHMRYHEFFRIADGKIAEYQAIWDIPELMMQAGAWPLSPSLGREWNIPAPASGDGLGPHDSERSLESRQLIVDMLNAMKRHPREPEEAMEMPKFWHPHMNWYGPSGIGSGRGVKGFRNWHQIPFLNAMPDRGQYLDEITYHFFAEGNYVGVTGWPDMMQTITQPGWLGIAPSGQKVAMRSLDFWRLELCGDGKRRIRENWVLVDLLHLYSQIGVDPLARMREFNKSRHIAMAQFDADGRAV